MAKPITKLSTIPTTTLQIGMITVGPFSVPAGKAGFIATLDQIGWPYTGGRAFDWISEVQQTNSDPWVRAGSDGVDDLPIPAKFGKPANQINFTGDIPNPDSSTRKIRFTITVYKVVTVSGSFSVY